MTFPPKDFYLIPDNDAKNLLRAVCDINRLVDKQDHIYVQIYGISTKDYYLILGNEAKNLLRPILYRPNYSNKVMTLPPKDFYLIPGNGAKNLLRPVCDIDRPVEKQDHIYIYIYIYI